MVETGSKPYDISMRESEMMSVTMLMHRAEQLLEDNGCLFNVPFCFDFIYFSSIKPSPLKQLHNNVGKKYNLSIVDANSCNRPPDFSTPDTMLESPFWPSHSEWRSQHWPKWEQRHSPSNPCSRIQEKAFKLLIFLLSFCSFASC